jgi:thiol-disulfide isomerase/thioredoxin
VPDIGGHTDLLSGRKVGELAGSGPVLLHFMTGGCVNCLHVLAELRRLRLPDEVTVVTVHTGKFPREREEGYVRELSKRYGLASPLVNDADAALWDAFAIRAWPTLVLVRQGYEAARASGEGQAAKLLQISETGETAPRSGSRRFKMGSKIFARGETLWLSRYGGSVVEADLHGKVRRVWEGFGEPQGLCVYRERLYVADRLRGTLEALDTTTGARRTVARGLRSPWGVTTDGRALQVAEAGSHRIVEVGFGGGVEVLAGLGHEGVREGDALRDALFAQPTDLAWLDGALYVADAEGSALRRIEKGRVETPIGWDLFTYGDSDGVGEEVRLQHPEGLCAGVGGCGNHRIFIADTYNGKVKAFDPLTGRVMTLVEGLDAPTGLAKVGCHLYIVDGEEAQIARFDISNFTLERIPIT